jgi:hypothetical protein
MFGQKARIGLTFSPTIGFLRTLDQNLENAGSRAGFSYGLLFDYRLDNNEHYAFSTGLFHSLTGGSFIAHHKDSAGTDTLTVTHQLKPQYINVPITLRLRTGEIGYITYYGQFGLNLGAMISPRENRTSVPAMPATDGTNVRIDHNVIPSLALQIGGGIEYSLSGATALLVGVFYDNGFTGLINDDFDKVTLRNIGLKAGIIF